MTKLALLLFALAAGCGGKKSAPTLTSGSGSAQQPADPKPDGDPKPETKDASSEEDPCAVPPPQ